MSHIVNVILSLLHDFVFGLPPNADVPMNPAFTRPSIGQPISSSPPSSCLFVPFLLWVSQFFALCLPSVWAHRLKAATAPGASPSDGSEELGSSSVAP